MTVSAVAEHVDEMIALADHHNLGYWRLSGSFLRGWACAKRGSIGEGIEPAEELGRLVRYGGELRKPAWRQ